MVDRIGELQAELNDLRVEMRAGDETLAVNIRKTRLNVLEAEQNRQIRLLRQPTALLGWTPRGGEPVEPAVANSLIDRLRRGQPVADSFGNVTVTIGQANSIRNPLLEGVDAVLGAATIGATPSQQFPGWDGHRVLHSGTAPNVWVTTLHDRGDPDNGSLNTAILQLHADPATSTPCDLDVYLYPEDWSPPYSLPYMVGSARVLADVAPPSHWTTRDFFVELFNVTTGTVVDSSDAIDLAELAAVSELVRQLWASTQQTAAAFHAARWQVRLRWHLVSNGGAATEIVSSFGEVAQHFAFSPDPIPFAPLVAAWQPSEVHARFGSDIDDRLRLDYNGIEFGPGTGPTDTRITRLSTGRLVFDSNDSAAGTLFDIRATASQPSRLRLLNQGLTDPMFELRWDTANGPQLRFGSGSGPFDLRIRRTSAGFLRLDANDPNLGIPIEFLEQTDPGAAPANAARLYARDNGSGKTQLVAVFSSGAVQVIATQP